MGTLKGGCMPNREIGVALGATINLGNFNSIRIDYSEKVTVPDDDNVDNARDELYSRVEDFISEKIDDIKKESGE